MSEKMPNESEEVDLGQLFKLIGNVFNKLFNFIANIFKGGFHFLLLLLIHFYRSLKWYVAAVVMGVIVGVLLDLQASKKFAIDMYVETNFGSSRQVYENIKNLNQLASENKDSIQLASLLNLSLGEVSNIRGFYVEPDIDENRIVQLFSDHKMKLDSVSRLEASYELFKEYLSYHNFTTHKIEVLCSSKQVSSNLSAGLVKYLANNDYLELLRLRTQQNLNKEGLILEKQTLELDSLTKAYFRIRLHESKKEPIPGSGTNLYLAGDNEQSNLLIDESILLEKKYALEERKREIEMEKLEKKDIITILSNFPNSGYDASEWYDKYKFILPLVLFGLVFVASSSQLLLNYLKVQDEALKG